MEIQNMFIKQLDHLNLTVANFEETAAWYKRVFGFEVVENGTHRGKPWGVLRAHDAMLCVYENPDRLFWPSEQLEKSKVHALRITNQDEFVRVLQREGVTLEYEGTWKYPHSTSWYVKDPTGYIIEVVFWTNDTIRFSTDK
jgi:catechol 2,3-dioxygenase-like lactoylglutathione lyase family enzyme